MSTNPIVRFAVQIVTGAHATLNQGVAHGNVVSTGEEYGMTKRFHLHPTTIDNKPISGAVYAAMFFQSHNIAAANTIHIPIPIG